MKSSNYDIQLKKLGQRIAELRKEKGLSQRELCFNIDGWFKSHLSEVEAGKRNLSTTSLIKVAEALDVKVKDLFVF